MEGKTVKFISGMACLLLAMRLGVSMGAPSLLDDMDYHRDKMQEQLWRTVKCSGCENASQAIEHLRGFLLGSNRESVLSYLASLPDRGPYPSRVDNTDVGIVRYVLVKQDPQYLLEEGYSFRFTKDNACEGIGSYGIIVELPNSKD